jgi:hypothetical protein
LPSRNDLMSEMQRTTWARHTTKWLTTQWYFRPQINSMFFSLNENQSRLLFRKAN